MFYSYSDFEEAYYRNKVYECKEIGVYLLKKLNTKKSKFLYKQLEKVEWSGDMTKEEHKFIAQLLREIKNYLMVNL